MDGQASAKRSANLKNKVEMMQTLYANFEILSLGIFFGPIIIIAAILLRKKKSLSRTLGFVGTAYFITASSLVYKFIQGENELARARQETTPSGWESFAYSGDSECDPLTSELVINVDLDGDNLSDRARLLRNSDTKKIGLFVYLSSQNKYENVKEFETASDLSLAVLKPGEVQTVCGKGYMDCPDGTPEVLKMEKPTLNVIYCEKTGFALVWNKLTKKFSEIWLSD